MYDLLSRRKLLKYASLSCLSLPLMRVLRESEAQAATANFTRAIFIYYPDGNIAQQFFPRSIGRQFELPTITQPLNPFKNYISFVRGLQFQTTGSHEAGAAFCLTGTSNPNERYSIDNFLGDQLGSKFPHKTLRLGVGANFQSGADKHISYLRSGTLAPVQDNPRIAFREIFGVPGVNRQDQEQLNRGKKSVLDFATRELSSLKQRLGSTEQKKLQEHLDSLRNLERRVVGAPSLACNTNINTRGLNFPEQEQSYPQSFELNERFGLIGAIMTDMLIQALACGVAPVALLQWSHAVSPTRFDFIGGPNVSMGHHDASHYGGDANGEFARAFISCQTWYMSQLSQLLTGLAQVKIGDRTLLDDTVVFMTTELGDSNLHDFKSIACVLAGGASGRLRTGQSLAFEGRSYNDLLMTVATAAGVRNLKFGDASKTSGPITELLR